MMNKIATRTICCIIALAAVIFSLTACTAPESQIGEIETTRVVARTVEVPVTEAVEPAVEVTRVGPTAAMIIPLTHLRHLRQGPLPRPGQRSRPSRLPAQHQTLHVGHISKARPI